jgi:hypothetical protein
LFVQKEYRRAAAPCASSPKRLFSVLNLIPIIRGLFTSRRACALFCDSEPKAGSPIFVTVHGTWTPYASWTGSKSKLLAALAIGWPDAGIYRFKWSGTNGLRHKLTASDVLFERLDCLSARYPESQIVAIAHSHGGNVVAWASTRVSKSLAGAIYLNTPFIQVMSSASRFNVVLRAMLYILGAFIFVPLAIKAPALLPISSDGSLDFFVSASIIIAGLALLQLLVPARIQKLRDRLAKVTNSARKVRVELVGLTVGDEPSAAFGALYFVRWSGHILAIILLMTVPFILNSRAIARSQGTQVAMTLAGGFLAAYVAYLTIAITVYGLTLSVIALDSYIAVTPAPVGRSEIVTMAGPSQYRLRHSLIHESPDAIALIVDWLRSRLPINAE